MKIGTNTVLQTSCGLELNRLLPSGDTISDKTADKNKPWVVQAGWQMGATGDTLVVDVEQMLSTGELGQALLAHEFGHKMHQDESLIQETALLAKFLGESAEGKLNGPQEQIKTLQLKAITRSLEILQLRELEAWDIGKILADFLEVPEASYERYATLALKRYFKHSYVMAAEMVRIAVGSADLKQDRIALYNPSSGDYEELTLEELFLVEDKNYAEGELLKGFDEYSICVNDYPEFVKAFGQRQPKNEALPEQLF